MVFVSGHSAGGNIAANLVSSLLPFHPLLLSFLSFLPSFLFTFFPSFLFFIPLDFLPFLSCSFLSCPVLSCPSSLPSGTSSKASSFLSLRFLSFPP
jgi:acetyl esterase/lipase